MEVTWWCFVVFSPFYPFAVNSAGSFFPVPVGLGRGNRIHRYLLLCSGEKYPTVVLFQVNFTWLSYVNRLWPSFPAVSCSLHSCWRGGGGPSDILCSGLQQSAIVLVKSMLFRLQIMYQNQTFVFSSDHIYDPNPSSITRFSYRPPYRT